MGEATGRIRDLGPFPAAPTGQIPWMETPDKRTAFFGREVVVDLTQAAAAVTDAYANFQLTTVDDHVVRMSVMTEPFYWHRHPDSDETFLVVEGGVLLQTMRARVELTAGQLYTVPAGREHITSPMTERSVNITIERIGMTTERVAAPASIEHREA
jgi:mannose-6-phosphate isomerase-like protein (cupin superfamily)